MDAAVFDAGAGFLETCFAADGFMVVGFAVAGFLGAGFTGAVLEMTFAFFNGLAGAFFTPFPDGFPATGLAAFLTGMAFFTGALADFLTAFLGAGLMVFFETALTGFFAVFFGIGLVTFFVAIC